MRVLVDTNVLICDQQNTHEMHTQARQALRILSESAVELAVVPQVIAEFWNVCTRPAKYRGLGLDVPTTISTLGRIKRAFTLYRDQPAIYDQWEKLAIQYNVQGAQVHDTRLVAAMLTHDLTHILTFNTKDFKRFDEISIIAPQSVTAPWSP